MMWSAIYVLLVIIALLITLTFERIPADIAMFTALLVVWAPGIISTKDALAGWSNGGLMTVVALFVVVGGVQKLPVLQQTAMWVFGRGGNGRISLIKQIALFATLSVFINNTPLVAFFVPIVVDWCRTHNQSPSKYLIPLSYACIMGDLSVIGTSTNLVVQGILQKKGEPLMNFFDIAYVGGPALVIGTLYLITVGWWLLPNSPSKAPDSNADNASVADYTAELVVERGSPLIGKHVNIHLSTVFSGQARLVKLLRKPTPPPSNAASPSTDSPAAAIVEVLPIAAGNADDVFSDDLTVAEARASGVHLLVNKSEASSGVPVGATPLSLEGAGYELVFPIGAAEVFHEGDRLIAAAPPSTLVEAHAVQGTHKLRFVVGETVVDPINTDKRYVNSARSTLTAIRRKLVRAPELPPDASPAAHASNETDPPAPQRHAYEVLLSNRNPFIGASVASKALQEHYGATILGIRITHSNALYAGLTTGTGSPVNAADEGRPDPEDATGPLADASSSAAIQEASPETSAEYSTVGPTQVSLASVGDVRLLAGDSLLLLARRDFLEDYGSGRSRDFFVATRVAGASKVAPVGWFQYGSLILLILMFVLGSVGVFEMEKAAMLAAGVNLLCGYVSPKEMYKLIQWDLVVLIGASFGLGTAMETTGLAADVAGLVVGLNAGNHGTLFLMYGVVLIMTELISNNAAAQLTIPIAIEMAKQLKVSHKPFIMAVTVGATAAFAVPLGYQTHLMVMGPGGYTARDFFKVGIIMDVLYWAVIAGLAPVVWPF